MTIGGTGITRGTIGTIRDDWDFRDKMLDSCFRRNDKLSVMLRSGSDETSVFGTSEILRFTQNDKCGELKVGNTTLSD